MSVTIDAITEAVRNAKDESKERKFKQSIDLAIALRDVDLKDPSKRFRAEILLPHKINKPVRLCVIGDEAMVAQAKEAGVEHTLKEDDIERLAKDANEAKSFISQIDYFLALPQMMASVGKSLGRFLGPAGKMPSVLPPNANVEDYVTRYGRTCRIRLRQNPVIHALVGTEDMENGEIAANIRTILNEIEGRLEQGPNNIRATHVKTTMGPAIKIGV